MIFQWFNDLIETWKNLLVIFNDEKIMLSSSIDSMISYWEREYVSDHNFALMWWKLITILNLSFFQITNVRKTAEEKSSRKTNHIWF